MVTKKVNVNNKSINVKRIRRVDPRFKKKGRCIALSTQLIHKIKRYKEKFLINESQIIERGMTFFFSYDLSDAIIEMERAEETYLIMKQRVQAIKQRKDLLKVIED